MTASSVIPSAMHEERRRRLRGRNRATLAALLGLVALFYAITLVRMGIQMGGGQMGGGG